jgi:hypothetical protein
MYFLSHAPWLLMLLLLYFCCDILWYSTIVTVILRFFVMTAYAFATSPGHLSQLSFHPLIPLFVILSLSWPATCSNSQLVLRLSSYVQSIAIHHRHLSASLNSHLLIFQAPLGPESCCHLVHSHISCHWTHTLSIEFINPSPSTAIITIAVYSIHQSTLAFIAAAKQRKEIGIGLFLGWTFVSLYGTYFF